MMVLSEMQLESSLSELDAQDKSPPGQSSTNSGWDKVFEDSGTLKDKAAKLPKRKAEQHNSGLSEILEGK